MVPSRGDPSNEPLVGLCILVACEGRFSPSPLVFLLRVPGDICATLRPDILGGEAMLRIFERVRHVLNEQRGRVL